MVAERARSFVNDRIGVAKQNLDDFIDTITKVGPVSGLIPLVSDRGEKAASRRASARRKLVS